MTGTSTPAFRPAPIAIAWVLAVGVDLFFNAGLFGALFDQGAESSLLPDDVLFARIPVAYAALVVGVAALGWLLDASDETGGRRGGLIGSLAGGTFASLGVVNLWTAIELTGAFVAAAVVVQVAEFGVAGWYLGAHRAGRARPWLALGAALALAGGGIVIQNLAA